MPKKNKTKVTEVTNFDAPPPFDDLMLAPTPDGGVSFTLLRDGVAFHGGVVTRAAANKARIFLNVMFEGWPRNVAPFPRPM